MTAVYLQWPAQSDGPDGVGVYGYLIYRDGQFLDRVTGTSYVDQAVEAGHTYTYSISAEDFHGNASTPATFDVSVPAEGLPPIEDGDGRCTG
jgi:chitin-binding protein